MLLIQDPRLAAKLARAVPPGPHATLLVLKGRLECGRAVGREEESWTSVQTGSRWVGKLLGGQKARALGRLMSGEGPSSLPVSVTEPCGVAHMDVGISVGLHPASVTPLRRCVEQVTSLLCIKWGQ